MWKFIKSLFGSFSAPLLGEQLQRLLRGEDWYQSQLGNRLSNSQREANRFTQMLQEDSQAFNSSEAAKQRQFQIDFYNQVQSPQAQVEAYKSAGINPAAIFGNLNAPSAAGGSAASSVPLSSVGAGAGVGLQSVVDLYFQKQRLDLDKRLADAEIRNKDSETMLNNIDSQFRSAERELGLEEGRARVQSTLANVQRQLSDIDVNNSTIEVNGHRIELLDSQTRRSDADTVLSNVRAIAERLDVEKAQRLLPFIEARERAQIALFNSQSEYQQAAAENALYDANLSMLNGMREAQLIDDGYYEQMVKTQVRQYKWAPINNIVGDVGKIAGAVLGITTGAAAIGKLTGAVGSIASRPILYTGSSGSIRTDYGNINYGR